LNTGLKKNIFFTLIFATLFYFIFLIYSDYEVVINSIVAFPITKFIFTLLLITISIILKFIRWHYYIFVLKIRVTFLDSVIVFLAGLIMSISPGKIGELLKSYLIKKRYDIPISKTLPIIFAERVIEFLALIILGTIGVTYLKISGYTFILFFFSIAVIAFILFTRKQVITKLIIFFTKLNIVKKNIHNLEIFKNSLSQLLEMKPFLYTFGISIAAWIVECLAFYSIIYEFDTFAAQLWSIFVYLIAILFGAISMLPGGIGSTEASLTYLITQNGVSENIAISSTILIRVSTLWFSVLVGFLSLFVFYVKKK